jgi:hypothetical protein
MEIALMDGALFKVARADMKLGILLSMEIQIT